MSGKIQWVVLMVHVSVFDGEKNCGKREKLQLATFQGLKNPKTRQIYVLRRNVKVDSRSKGYASRDRIKLIVFI